LVSNTGLWLQAIAFLCSMAVAGAEQDWFGGEPPLGADDHRRHAFHPYTAVEQEYLGANYCENLLDKRINITSYTHQGFNSNKSDAWHLQFPDDASRIVESLVWEDRYSGVARIETVRRIVKGLLAAHIPGTQGYHFFRHRSGGKTYLIFDDSSGEKEGRLLLSTWGDSIEDDVSVGFETQSGGAWLGQEDFSYTDKPKGGATPGIARSTRYWNASPFALERDFVRPDISVGFGGRYWLSDEDMPTEFAYTSGDADRLAITIGKRGRHIPLLGGPGVPGTIHLPDRATRLRSDVDGDVQIDAPAFNYIVLRKRAAWTCPGYSSALLIMWDGRPQSIEALAQNGYGQVRVVYGRDSGQTKGRVWLLPVRWLNEDDMGYVFRNAESFLATGRLMQNGFPSQQLVNAIPTGLASGALMLTKYNDPFAPTARTEAANAVDVFLDPEHKGRRFIRLFFEVKAAAWMALLGKELGDADMARKYTAWVRLTMERMLSPESGYDGKAWSDGWTHFNCMKAAWLAYEATGDKSYRAAYERAMDVYTIDAKGVYRYGAALDVRMKRGYYLVEVSPDGKHWLPRLDTWCDRPSSRSLDISFLTGSREELVRTLTITPPDDAAWLQPSSEGTEVVRQHCRTVAVNGQAVYSLSLPNVDACHLEFLVGNDYRVDLSSDGRSWTPLLNPAQITPHESDDQEDAGWLRTVDATEHVNGEDRVYVRVRDGGHPEAYGGKPAFLRRLAVYATYKTPVIHVRIGGAPCAQDPTFLAERVRVRTW